VKRRPQNRNRISLIISGLYLFIEAPAILSYFMRMQTPAIRAVEQNLWLEAITASQLIVLQRRAGSLNVSHRRWRQLYIVLVATVTTFVVRCVGEVPIRRDHYSYFSTEKWSC
jgi:hypothetical protein